MKITRAYKGIEGLPHKVPNWNYLRKGNQKKEKKKETNKIRNTVQIYRT